MGLFGKKNDDDDGFGYTSSGRRVNTSDRYGRGYDNSNYGNGSFSGNLHGEDPDCDDYSFGNYRVQQGYDLDGCGEARGSRQRKKKKGGSTLKGFLIGTLLTWAIVIGVIVGAMQAVRKADCYFTVLPNSMSAVVEKIAEIDDVIDELFIFDYDEEKAADAACEAYLSALDDPYTCYYTEAEYEAMMESTSGSYYGIGVMISQLVDSGEIYVLRVFTDSPAEEAGMQPGDRIIQAAGQDVTKMDINEAVTLIKGAEGSTVELVIKRGTDSEEETLTLNVERRKVSQDTVYYSMLDDNIGYLELTEFDSVSVTQFQKAIDKLTEEGMTSLILDLRSNPGGLLDVAVDIADILIDTGTVVTITYKDYEDDVYEATNAGELGIPVVVLVDGNSASASEVLSGCLKDYGVATLVGTQTYGKGIVQQIIPLSDGTAMKVTIAHYYTPNGTDIHGVGITPDVLVEDDLSTEEDEQLDKAIEVIKGLQ